MFIDLIPAGSETTALSVNVCPGKEEIASTKD